MRKAVSSVLLMLMTLAGCASEQSFTLVDADSPQATLANSRVVVEAHTTMSYARAKEKWYQVAFPFLPILTIDDWRHDVDIAVDEVVKGTETQPTLKIVNYRELSPEEIDRLPYPHDLMGILGGELRLRLGYDKRIGDRFSNLKIVPLGNTPALTDAFRGMAARPTTRPGVRLVEGGVVRGDVAHKRIALVFTGGDYAEGVPTILRVCKEQGVPASFFVTGDFLRKHPQAAKDIVRAGHLLGPHSDKHLLYCDWDDRRKTLVTEKAFKDDLRKNAVDLRKLGAMSPYFLPPFEWYNQEQTAWAADLGLTLVNFSPGSGSNRDYIPESDPKFTPSARIVDGILAYEQRDKDGLNGFILLLHAGSQRRDKMHDHLESLLTALAGRGYVFVTLDQLLQP